MATPPFVTGAGLSVPLEGKEKKKNLSGRETKASRRWNEVSPPAP